MDGISRQGMGSLSLSETECLTSSVDLFTKPKKELALVSGGEISYRPNLLNGPIEFNIGGNTSRYMQLSTMRLVGTAKIVQKDGAAILPYKKNDADTAKTPRFYSVCNMVAPSLFESMEISIGGLPISDLKSDLMPYKAYIESLFSYGKDAQMGHLEGCGFCMDDAGLFDDVGASSEVQSANKGNVKRSKRLLQSKEWDFSYNIGQDFFQVDRFVPGRLPLKLKLGRSKDEFVVLAHADTAAALGYKVVITDLTLYVRAVSFHDILNKVIEDKWLSGDVLQYPISKTVVKPFTVNKGQTSVILPQLFEGPIPKTIIVGQLADDAFNGSYNKNPYNFQHFKTNRIFLRVRGVSVPSDPYTPDFENERYMRNYHDLFYNAGINHDNLGNCINHELFGKGCFLQPFDLTPNADNGYQLHELGMGNVELHINWAKPLDDPITVLVYASFDAAVEIDKDSRARMVYSGTGEERFSARKG